MPKEKHTKAQDDNNGGTVQDIIPDDNLHPDVLAALNMEKKTKPDPTEYVSEIEQDQTPSNESISTLF